MTRCRRYSTSTSRDGERMLRGIRIVQERQWPFVEGNTVAEAARQRGHARWARDLQLPR